MSIKESSFSQQSHAYERVLSSLTEFAKTKHLPSDLKLEVKKLAKKFKEYDIKQHQGNLTQLTGEYLTQDEFKSILIEGSGYTKWTVSPDSDGSEADFFADRFNVEVTQINSFIAERKCNSRSDLYLVTVDCLPGHVYVCLATDRVSYDSDVLIKNEELKAYLEAQFSE